MTYDSSDDGNYTVYKGLIYKVVDGEGSVKNSYDTRERLVKTTRHLNLSAQDYTTVHTFDDADRISSIAYPSSGPTVTYDYHPSGSLFHASRGAYRYYTANAADYDEFGHVTGFSFGNGKSTTRSYYDKSKRLQQISCTGILTKDYQYSAADDVTTISGTTVTYDNLHRIKRFGAFAADYTYDTIGNLTHTAEGGGSDLTYGAARKQAVKSAFGKTYLYDACGNMIVRKGASAGSQALEYDPENRLTRFSQAGTVVVEYGYDADGARLWKRKNQTQLQVWIGNLYEEKDGKTLFHVFAGNQRICTFEPTSTLNGGADHSDTVVGCYYHQDHLNSSSALSGDTGTQLEVNVWYPFGSTQTASPQAAFKVANRFTGQVLDEETGLYYYGARYFDPELGRFIQPDTIIPDFGNPQSLNRYAYTLNNPLKYVDPTGHDNQYSSGYAAGLIYNNAPVSISFTLAPVYRFEYHGPQSSISAPGTGPHFNAPGYTTVIPTDYHTVTGASAGGDPVAGLPLAAVGGATRMLVRGALSPLQVLDAFNPALSSAEQHQALGEGLLSAGLYALPIKVGPGAKGVYSVAFEMRLTWEQFALSQERHFQIANEALQAERASNPALAQLVSAPDKWGRPPNGWTWQHATIEQGRGNPGVMQLVPRDQHTPGSPFWPVLHPLPGGAGGYSQWAVPAGAPPR